MADSSPDPPAAVADPEAESNSDGDGVPCPYCSATEACRNDLLHHIILHHNANMSQWPTPDFDAAREAARVDDRDAAEDADSTEGI